MKYFLLFLLWLKAGAGYAQSIGAVNQLEQIDFKRIEAEVSILPEGQRVEGNVTYYFEILQQTDSVYLDAQNMKFEAVKYNGEEVNSRNTGDKLWIKDVFLPSSRNQITLEYSATPKQAMYFINWDVPAEIDATRQVWTQGQGKNTSHWLPVIDDLNEKAEFDLSVIFKEDYQVVANGKLTGTEAVNDSLLRWEFDMAAPMSSYLLAIAVGKFTDSTAASASGIPLNFFMSEKHSEKMEPTYRYSKEIFDFLEEEIGVAYPWQNYSQIPVQDFLYAGMENTGTTIFAEALITDSTGFKDKNYVNVDAHELAHQWFGNLVTQTESRHHWLHEGFATYYALLAEREIFGDDYFYWKLYESAEKLKKMSDSGKGEALLNPKASSLTFYQKGAWALHILRERVGDKSFREGVQHFLKLYKFQNGTTNNFIAEMEATSNMDLSGFIEDWLEQSAFKATEALNSLKKSSFMGKYLEIAGLRETPLLQKAEQLEKALQFPVNDYIGQEVVFQLAGEKSPEANKIYKKAFETNNLYTRQAIATTMDEVPQELKFEYESLLGDDSYLTQEAALFNLWSQFPEDNHKYLEQTRGVEGFYEKNVRMLWLTLNLVTPTFDAGNQQKVYEELSGYTATYYPFEVRENAFGYLYQINSFSEQNLKDLVHGTQHHNSRFRNFCRQLLERLLQSEEYRQKYVALVETFSGKQQDFLNQKLKE